MIDEAAVKKWADDACERLADERAFWAWVRERWQHDPRGNPLDLQPASWARFVLEHFGEMDELDVDADDLDRFASFFFLSDGNRFASGQALRQWLTARAARATNDGGNDGIDDGNE